jgi:hypothetical protein
MKQGEAILAHLESGKPITSLDAIRLYRCTRLAVWIHLFKKKGMTFKKEIGRSVGPDGEKKSFAIYTKTGNKPQAEQEFQFAKERYL